MKPRERDQQVFSLQGMNVTVSTLEAVKKTVFVELFCTPKSSIENPSLRVNGHGGSTSRTVIVENFAEDEFGQCAIDEVTGAQGYIDGESFFFFLHMGRERENLAVQTVQRSPSEEKKKEKVKVDSKEPEEHSLVNRKQRTLNGGPKKIMLGGPRVRKSRKALRKEKYLSEGDLNTYHPEKGTCNDFHSSKGRGKEQKRKGKESAHPQSGLSASESPSEEGHGHSWE